MKRFHIGGNCLESFFFMKNGQKLPAAPCSGGNEDN